MQTIMKCLGIGMLLILLQSVTTGACLPMEKGQGEVTYQTTLGAAEKTAAVTLAMKNVLTRYVAKYDVPRIELYRRIESKVLENIDQYVINVTEVDKTNDTANKRYSVIIQASINETLIESTIQKNSSQAVVDTGGQKAERSYITFVFVAREQTSRKIFDAKRTTVDLTESTNKGTETKKIADDAQGAEHSVDKDSLVKRTTGGNTEIKADEFSYKVTTISGVDNAVNAVLTKAGYETVDAGDVGLDVDAFKKDFSTGDIASATRVNAIKTCREKDIKYFAIANMDVGLPQVDEATGLKRVYVTVTAKVSDLTSKLPKTVASLAGVPYAGLGSDSQVAKQNALNEAAVKSAVDLMDQLRLKNVH